MNGRGLDVRVVANIVLDEADAAGISVSNLHLNKAIFFMHVDCMRDRGHRLVSAKIEAWQYGPVFREIYNQFKTFKARNITTRAKRVDFDSGELVEATDNLDVDLERFVRDVARFYIQIPAPVLVDLSHAPGGAWDYVWNKSGSINVGMEITEEVIEKLELSKQRKVRLA